MKYRILSLLILLAWGCSSSDSLKEQVVYLKQADGNFDLYRSDVLGKWEERLTTNPGYDWQPNWNSNLNKLIYYSNDSLGNFAVLAKDLTNGQVDSLAMAQLSDFQLSPDGLNIFYTISEGDSKNIWKCDLNGSNPHQLTVSEGYNGRFELSADGRKMAFISDRTGTNQLFIMDLKSGEAEQISFFPLVAKYSSWSPDGEQIAVCLAEPSDDPKWDIWLYNLKDRELERFTNTPYSEQEIVWSFSGKKIAFHGTTENDGDQIYTLDLADGKFTKITSGDFYHGEPAWVPVK